MGNIIASTTNKNVPVIQAGNSSDSQENSSLAIQNIRNTINRLPSTSETTSSVETENRPNIEKWYNTSVESISDLIRVSRSLPGPPVTDSYYTENRPKIEEWYKERNNDIDVFGQQHFACWLLDKPVHSAGLPKITEITKVQIDKLHRNIMVFEKARDRFSEEGKGIRFMPDDYPPIKGDYSELEALALLDAYFARKEGVEKIPLLAQKKPVTSLRKITKELNNSIQGEVLQTGDFVKVAKFIGYDVKLMMPDSLLALNNLIEEHIGEWGVIYFFQTDPSVEWNGTEETLYNINSLDVNNVVTNIKSYEQAAVIARIYKGEYKIGQDNVYDWENAIVTLEYSGESHPGIPLKYLYLSNHVLTATHDPLYYLKMNDIKLSAPPQNENKTGNTDQTFLEYKYNLLAPVPRDPDTVKKITELNSEEAEKKFSLIKTITPVEDSGFRGVIMFIKPDENHSRWKMKNGQFQPFNS